MQVGSAAMRFWLGKWAEKTGKNRKKPEKPGKWVRPDGAGLGPMRYELLFFEKIKKNPIFTLHSQY
jgi:hypothetical protein